MINFVNQIPQSLLLWWCVGLLLKIAHVRGSETDPVRKRLIQTISNENPVRSKLKWTIFDSGGI